MKLLGKKRTKRVGSKTADKDKQNATVENEGNATKEHAYFGTYTIPADWVYLPQFSGGSKRFYAERGAQSTDQPNNISVEFGTNSYALDQHPMFSHAILLQLGAQGTREEWSESTLKTDISSTAKDYILFEFLIGSKELGHVTTAQYYIVGEYCFILIHATIFDPSASNTNTLDIARQIADSFIWSGDMQPA